MLRVVMWIFRLFLRSGVVTPGEKCVTLHMSFL